MLVWLAVTVGLLIRIAVQPDRRDAAWLANLREMAQGYGKEVEDEQLETSWKW